MRVLTPISRAVCRKKTHTRAVYRKLDASSRGEAVVRAQEAGLLDAVANGSGQI